MKSKEQLARRRSRARRGAVTGAVLLLALGTLMPAAPVFARGPVTIPNGTTIDVRVDTPIDSNAVRRGDEFRAVVTSAVVIRGEDVIPGGTTVTGVVSDVVANRSFGKSSGAVIRLEKLSSPTGVSVAINGNLSNRSGSPFLTVDNLPRGARMQLTVQRSFVVEDDFYGSRNDDVFTSEQTITQVQAALRDRGYYTGRIDGRLTPATRQAITLFQRDQRLNQTGFLDQSTLERLGLISQSGSEVVPANVISADARIRSGNALNIHVVTTGATGMTVFEDHFKQRDAIHIYVRGFRNAAGPRATGELDVALTPEEWRGIDRIVVHGAGNDIVIRANEVAGGSVTPQQAARLELAITRLLQQYASALGVRYVPGTGQLAFSQSLNYRENETELLFALNSAAATARLYTQLVRTSDDPQAIQGATDVFIAQANAVERAVSRTKSGRATNVIAGWQALRDDFKRLDDASSKDFQGTPAYR